jgi:hypothetical protein
MADRPSEPDDLTLDLRASSSPRPTVPPWLTEAVLVLRAWWTRWLPLPLVTRVRVERGRAGTFEVIDFVLVLLAYAVSGAATLRAFYEQARPAAPALMGSWQRHALPSRSALSRFLGDVSWTAVESLRTLFVDDLLHHGADAHHLGGLVDRQGKKHIVFDADGTRQAYRQRAIVGASDRPPARRRAAKLAAPGYAGRKRGEVMRSRLTVQQAHTREWLGTFGESGNGQLWPRLERRLPWATPPATPRPPPSRPSPDWSHPPSRPSPDWSHPPSTLANVGSPTGGAASALLMPARPPAARHLRCCLVRATPRSSLRTSWEGGASGGPLPRQGGASGGPLPRQGGATVAILNRPRCHRDKCGDLPHFVSRRLRAIAPDGRSRPLPRPATRWCSQCGG